MWNKAFLRLGSVLAASAVALTACGGAAPATIKITGGVAVEHGRKALEMARHHFGTHEVTAEQVVKVFPEVIAEDPLHEWWRAEVVGEAAQISFLVISEKYRKEHPDVTYPLISPEEGHGTGNGGEHGLAEYEVVTRAGFARLAAEENTDTTVPVDPLDEVLNGGTLPPAPTTTVEMQPKTAPETTTTTTPKSTEGAGAGGLPENAFEVAVAACVREINGEMRVREGVCPTSDGTTDDHSALGHSSSEHASDAPHWSYSGEKGQEHWGELSEEYATCENGREQSPIDIKAPTQARFSPPVLNYNATGGTAMDNGHTLKVSFELGSSIQLDGLLYRLVELHFHATSEHTLEGTKYPAELHFVHKTFDGHVAVIGVLLERGTKPDAAWGSVIDALASAPAVGGAEVKKLQLQQIMPRDMEVYRYQGSLTTPPCSEGVKWSLVTEPVKVSAKQLAKLTKRYSANSRAVQPQNEREVLVLPVK